MEKILKLLRTKQEATELGTLVESAIAALYKVGQGNLEGVYKSNSRFGKALYDALPSTGDIPSSEKVLKGLQTQLAKLQTVNITIAIEPTDELLDAMSAWADKNFEQKTIYDVKVDPHIVGGAQVTIGGKYTDATLLKKLNTYFETSGPKLFKSLNL